jgi:hypothetical protein
MTPAQPGRAAASRVTLIGAELGVGAELRKQQHGRVAQW